MTDMKWLFAAVFILLLSAGLFVESQRVNLYKGSFTETLAALKVAKQDNLNLLAELDKANAQLPCEMCQKPKPRRPKVEAKRPVPAFERGGKRTD